MKLFKNIFILTILTFVVCVTSCEKEYVKNAYSAQEKRISQFVKDSTENNPNYKVIKDGKTTKVIVKEGNGESINKNSVITFHFISYIFPSKRLDNSNIISTNIREVAENLKLNLSNEEIFTLKPTKLKDGNYLEGLYLGLLGMKKGEEAYILFSGRYGYGEVVVGTIPYCSALAYHVWIESVEN